jgi:hypothetical protein
VISLELAVSGRDSAPRIAVVDDVVVDEGGGVKKLEPCCQVNDPLLFGVFVGVHRDVAERDGRPPSPIRKASAESLSAVKKRFGYRGECVGVRRDLWYFTM